MPLFKLPSLSKLPPRQKRIVIIVASVFIFYLLFGFFGAPLIVRGVLEKKVAKIIGRPVSVATVRVNPLTLSVTFRDLKASEKDDTPFIQVDEAYANLQVSSVFRRAVVLKTIRLITPDIHLVRFGDTAFNFSDIGQDAAAQPPDAEQTTDAGGTGLMIGDLTITGGHIALDDRVVSVNHRIEDLNLNIRHLSFRPADVDDATDFDLSARINDAGVVLKGQSRPFRTDRQTHASMHLTTVSLLYYLPYVTLPPNLIIQSFGLETENEIDFRLLADGQPELVVAGQTTFNDVRATDGRGAPFVYHPRLSFDLLPSKILTGELRFGRIESDRPEYHLKRLASGNVYLPFLAETAFEKAEEKAKTDATGMFQPEVTINTLNLSRAVVHLTDLSNRQPFSTTISRLDLAVENIELNSDRMAAYRLSLETDAGEAASLRGTACLKPLQAVGKVSLTDIKVPRYAPYVQDRFGFKTTSGRLSLSGNVRFSQADSTQVTFSGLHLQAEDLNLQDNKNDAPLLCLGRLDVADTTFDLSGQQISLGRVALDDTQLFCRREKDGRLNWVEAFSPFACDGSKTHGRTPTPDVESETKRPAESFVVNMANLGISDVTVDVVDAVPSEPVHLRMDKLTLSATDLSSASGQTGRAELGFNWADKGQVQIGGKVALNPVALDLSVNIDSLDMRPFQPYLSEHAGVIVTQGLFNIGGQLQLSHKKTDDLPEIVYQGDAQIGHFASIDRKNANDFLNWEGLRFDTLRVTTNPLAVSVGQIQMNDFFARVIVDPQGNLNLITMLEPPVAPSTNDDPSTASTGTVDNAGDNSDQPKIQIGQIHFNGGDVDLSDQFIKPNFRARFQKLSGQVSGLASIEEKKADVLLEGMWGSHAPVKISGQINPLIDNPFVDLTLNISDIELSPFSPYSGKYIGYILEKGKLTFNVDYFLENRKLEGKNSISIDQLTLGDSVDSPDAVDLPIKLAVALLKDRDGNIQLDLPVSGSLDDPRFKVSKVVLTVLKNLVVKIVSSPFAALSNLAGGQGEALRFLEFESGGSVINAENSAKLDKLATILFERPALNLDIKGEAVSQADRQGLQSILLENRLKAKKLREMMKSGKSAVPLEDITISAKERVSLIGSVFDSADIPAPVDSSGKPVDLTPSIMEQLLLEHTPVTENDYRHLANLRALNAKDYLIKHGQVARHRLFIVEPRIGLADTGQETAATGRVVFSLR
ncbi:DUF748 domain-containing protein [Desulfosarcina variabilis]|uniref:DUF748 domain-containing protein n=1 Tax=Desulfosarcina variabilis TaxID=2300 RepID=UPI003AFA7C6F